VQRRPYPWPLNFGDTATFSNITIVGDPEIEVCSTFTGVPKGEEPTQIGEGPDGTNCRFAPSDITFR
jgi:hypothetical protein